MVTVVRGSRSCPRYMRRGAFGIEAAGGRFYDLGDKCNQRVVCQLSKRCGVTRNVQIRLDLVEPLQILHQSAYAIVNGLRLCRFRTSVDR